MPGFENPERGLSGGIQATGNDPSKAKNKEEFMVLSLIHILAAQPTRGVDIGSIEGIRKLIDQAKREGLGVLLISADIDEILALSDRIIVMYEEMCIRDRSNRTLKDCNLSR